MSEFASAKIEAGQLNAVVKNIMRQTDIKDPVEAVRQFNAGLWVLSNPNRRWEERDGVIYLTVVSDGTTGPEWITRLEKAGFRVGTYAKQLLCSADFHPTSGVIYQLAILKGMLFEDGDRVTKKIRANASDRKFTAPNAEAACLIRFYFSDEEIEAMGLYWIVTMHEPIKDADGVPHLLHANRDGGGRYLVACYDEPDDRWSRGLGFAFVVSQVSSEN